MAIQKPPLVAPQDGPSRWRRLVEAINQLIDVVGSFVGGSNANVNNFGAGYVAYGGLNNSLQGSIQLEFGTNLPNPAGLPGPALFIGSGGGGFTASISGTVMTVTAVAAGTLLGRGQLIKGAATGTGITSLGTGTGGVGTYNVNVSQSLASGPLSASAAAWILTDQAYDSTADGNFLGCTAGETQPSGTANGGQLFFAGGASFGGTGGGAVWQGGTSANARGGDATLQGGPATGSTAAAIAGNAVVSSGQVGKVPGNVVLSANVPPGATGVSVIRHQFGSGSGTTLMIDEYPDGSWYIYGGGGFGTAGQKLTSQGPGLPVKWA